MRIFGTMKTRLNLTVDEALLSHIKAYAARKQISVSELVESYFKRMVRPPKKKNILHLVESLDTPAIDPKADLKKSFYREQSEKYGF